MCSLYFILEELVAEKRIILKYYLTNSTYQVPTHTQTTSKLSKTEEVILNIYKMKSF